MAIDMRAAVKITAGVTGQQAVDQLRTKMDRLGGVAGGLTSKFNMVKGALGALGAALAVREFAQFAQSAFNAADELQKLSIRTGASVEDLSKLDQAAKMSGTSLDSVAKGFTFLARQMNEAATKGGETAAIFNQLGVEFKNSDGTLRDTNAVFADLADRFAEMPDGAQKVALGQKLIGRGFTELIPLVNGGGDAIRNVTAIISTEFANRAALFNDTVDGMKNQTRGLINQGLNELLKSLQQILDVYKDVNVDSETVKKVFNGIGIAVKGLVIALDTLITGTRQAITVLQVFGDTLSNLLRFRFKDAKDAALSRLKEIETLGKEYQTRIDRLLNPPADRVSTTQTAGARSGGRSIQLIDEEDLKRQADAADREIDRITKIFDKLREDQKRAAEEIKRQGQAVFEATRTPAEALAAELDRLNKLLNAGAIDWDTYGRAVMMAQDKFDAAAKKSKDNTESLLKDIRNAAEGVGRSLSDAFVEFANTGKLAVRDMVNSIIQDLMRLVVQRAIVKPIFDAIGASFFANGGIMTSKGSLPLKTYSRGGIANSPQVAVFGEGRQPEAFVPLPDGRRIPVAMKGGTGSTNNVTVNVNLVNGQETSSNNGPEAAQLGNVISKAIQSEILKQQRPGGLLYGA